MKQRAIKIATVRACDCGRQPKVIEVTGRTGPGINFAEHGTRYFIECPPCRFVSRTFATLGLALQAWDAAELTRLDESVIPFRRRA